MSSTHLLTKAEVAERLHLTKRGVDGLMKSRRIPYLKLNRKTIRFDWPKVEAAYNACEVKAVTK